ncbi:MAG: hypothetical protein Q6353_014950 [Candidatus Sigynarchaeum springense]
MLNNTRPNIASRPAFDGADHLEESADDPVLSAPGLNASFGYANLTPFNFSITYQSSSNATPAYINLTVVHENWTTIHIMSKVPYVEPNYVAGVRYQAVITLPTIGNYSHYFVASNGTSTTRYPAVGSLPGPSLAALRNYTRVEVPFRWLNSSAATEPTGQAGRLMYDIPLGFEFTFYGKTFNIVQVSHFGFLRFNVLPWSSTNEQPINLPGKGARAQYTITACPNSTWNITPTGSSDLNVLITPDYVLIEQQLVLHDYYYFYTKTYDASYQYVIYRNGTLLLNFHHVTVDFAMSESMGVNFGDGIHFTAFSHSSSIANRSFVFNYGFTTSPRILNYTITPASGTQVTIFNFTLTLQDIENKGPYAILVELDGTNRTMAGADPLDLNLMDGKVYTYSIQFLQPGTHSHRFHVLGPGGWWHSPINTIPLVTYENTHAPTIENLTIDPTQGWINFTNVTIRFTYRDLDNDGPANLVVIFNVSGSVQNLYPIKVSGAGVNCYIGCEFKLDLRYTNTTFLNTPGWQFYVFANDSTFTSSTQWINGPNLIQPFNYSASKLLRFENYGFSYTNKITTITSIDLPFNFTFYGLPFSSIVFSPRGFIRFTKNYESTLPAPGSTAPSSILSINLFTNVIGSDDGYYQLFPDKVILDVWNYVSGGTFNYYRIILLNNGRIIISFLNLNGGIAGGINLGDGKHYTMFPLSQVQVPITNVSFMFIPPGANPASISSTVSGSLFTTSQNIVFTAAYSSPANTPVVRAYAFIEGKDFHGGTLQSSINDLAFQASGFVDYLSGASFSLARTLPSGNYSITIHLVDIHGTHFTPATHHVIVNNPPTITPLVTPRLYGGVGQTLEISFTYKDDEGIAPEYFRITWNGFNYTFEPASSDYSKMVTFKWSIILQHGVYTYSFYVKDRFRDKEQKLPYNGTITVKWLPVIDIISLPPSSLLIPGSVDVKVRITSQEPGFSLVSKYVIVNGLEQVQLEPVSGEPDTYLARISLEWGEYHLSIVVSDGYNQVVYPAEGVISISVINLPLILGVSIGGAAAVAIVIFIQSRRKKAQTEQYARLRRQVLAKKPTRRDIEESAEEKRKARQEEVKNIEATGVIQPAPAPIKKSAAVKRATTSSASSSATMAPPPKASKAAPSSVTQPKDKSGYSQKATDTGTVVNRTVLKEYIERQRKEGVRELHYLKIKNDLNIISQKKSSKLYRILQDLVDDEILVRKGSNYIIVG